MEAQGISHELLRFFLDHNQALSHLQISDAAMAVFTVPYQWTVVVMALMVLCAGGAEEVTEGMAYGHDERVYLPGDDGMELGESMSVQGPGGNLLTL